MGIFDSKEWKLVANHSPLLNPEIATLRGLISDKDAEIDRLNAEVAKLNEQMLAEQQTTNKLREAAEAVLATRDASLRPPSESTDDWLVRQSNARVMLRAALEER